MIFCLFRNALQIVLVAMLFSSTVSAQLSCEELFVKSPLLSKDLTGEELINAARAIYEKQPERLAELENIVMEHVRATLHTQDVEFELVPSPGGTGTAFRIAESDASPPNRFARLVKEKYDAEILFKPTGLIALKNVASTEPSMSTDETSPRDYHAQRVLSPTALMSTKPDLKYLNVEGNV